MPARLALDWLAPVLAAGGLVVLGLLDADEPPGLGVAEGGMAVLELPLGDGPTEVVLDGVAAGAATACVDDAQLAARLPIIRNAVSRSSTGPGRAARCQARRLRARPLPARPLLARPTCR